jgi:hypothetical protein
VPLVIKAAVETQKRINEMDLDNISTIFITAGLQSELKTEILKHNYIYLQEIKVAA